MSTLTTLVANPRPASRTHRLAEVAARALTDLVQADDAQTVDLAALGPHLLTAERAHVEAALARVAGSDLLLVATPVYKATYTGLLKVFLDGHASNALAGVTAVPLIVSAAPAHLLATDIHLRSVLVELGASVPTRHLGVLESQLAEPGPAVGEWVAAHGQLLAAAVAAPRT